MAGTGVSWVRSGQGRTPIGDGRTSFTWLVFCFLFCISSVSVGADKSEFELGLEEFSRGEYARALDYFLQVDVGAGGDLELQYNIAVCLYRLQRWPQARDAFVVLHQQAPEQALFAYNLAVTEKKLGNVLQAEAMFAELAQHSEVEELGVLAQRQYDALVLARLQSQQAVSPDKEQSPWYISANFNYGEDDNVIDPADLSSSEVDDTFAEGLVTASWYSDTDTGASWLVDGFAYSSRYDDVDEYDFDMLELGFKNYHSLGEAYWYWGGRLDSSRLGSDSYLNSYTANLGVGKKYDSQRYWAVQYRLRRLHSGQSDYDPLDGSSQRLQLKYGGRGWGDWELGYRYEYDDRDDDDYQTGFSSYSAHRHTMAVRWAKRLGQWQLELNGEYRYSDFLDENILSSGQSRGRRDNRLRAGLRSRWWLSPQWALNLEYNYTDNDANIDDYDFDRQIIMAGISWQTE